MTACTRRLSAGPVEMPSFLKICCPCVLTVTPVGSVGRTTFRVTNVADPSAWSALDRPDVLVSVAGADLVVDCPVDDRAVRLAGRPSVR